MKYKTSFAPTAASDLNDFERDRGIILPAPYREFLLDTNGGYGPEPCYLNVPDWNRTSIAMFLGLTTNETNSIRRMELGNFSKEIERQLVQIAIDPGGEIFVLDLRSKTYGAIYVRAHNSAPNRPPLIDPTGFNNWDDEEAELYHHVAPSFEAFLEMLQPEPED